MFYLCIIYVLSIIEGISKVLTGHNEVAGITFGYGTAILTPKVL